MAMTVIANMNNMLLSEGTFGSVSSVRRVLAEILNLKLDAVPLVNGRRVSLHHVLSPADCIEFVLATGKKGAWRQLDRDRFIETYEITPGIYDEWLADGLPRYESGGRVRHCEYQCDRWIEGRHGQTRRATAKPSTTPYWDRERRELWVDGQLIKQFRGHAENQVKLLECFQEEADRSHNGVWPSRVYNPFSGPDDSRQLSSAVQKLNRSQVAPDQLSFELNGKNEVIWTLAARE